MVSYNVKQICQNYYNSQLRQVYGDQPDGRNGGQVNLDNLRLRVVGEPKWTQIAPGTSASSEGPVRRVNVSKKDGKDDVYSDFETSKDSEMVVDVKVDQGTVKGLTQRMRLPLPPQLKTSLGESIKIDPSQTHSTIKDTMKITVKTGKEIPHDVKGATALVKCKEGEYQGRFSCTVALDGNVIFPSSSGTLQVPVNEIFKDMQVQGLPRKGGHNFQYQMEGSCVFRYDFEQTIEWQ